MENSKFIHMNTNITVLSKTSVILKYGWTLPAMMLWTCKFQYKSICNVNFKCFFVNDIYTCTRPSLEGISSETVKNVKILNSILDTRQANSENYEWKI